MRILQVIPYFVPAWNYGGPLQVAYGLSKELVKRGHKVTVYTTDASNATSRVKDRKEVIDGIEIKRFKNLSNALAFKYNISLPLGMFPELRRTLSSFDIVHLHEYRTIPNIAVHYYARKSGTPYVLQAHGSLARILTKLNLKKMYDNLWGYRILKDASKVIALNETEVRQYKSMGVIEDKIGIVPNGIDLCEFENLPQKGEFRKKYGLNDNEKILLYLGRIHETKGIDLLVRAFALLIRQMDGVKLVIVGPDGGYLSSLTKLAADLMLTDKIIFTGPIYEKNRLEAYVDADIYVLPSVYEIFGITALEACACGTPVICSKGCGIGNIIDGKAGFTVPCNEDQLNNAMLYMLSNKKIRQEFGLYGKLLVQEHYNWEKIVVHLESIYRTCLAGK